MRFRQHPGEFGNPRKLRKTGLKGTVSRNFRLLVFFTNQFPPTPQAPEYTIRAVSNFFENSRRYSQLKVCYRYQQHKQNWRQNLSPVSLTPVTNLPRVSLIPVVHLYMRISPRIFEKIRNGPNGILWGWGETDS